MLNAIIKFEQFLWNEMQSKNQTTTRVYNNCYFKKYTRTLNQFKFQRAFEYRVPIGFPAISVFHRLINTRILNPGASHRWLRDVEVIFKVYFHYNDVIMGTVASQITSLAIVYSTVDSDTDQRKHQSSAPLAFVRGIHRGTGEFPAQMASNAENVSIWWRHHV